MGLDPCLITLALRGMTMKWNKYTLQTKTDAVDIISATLADIGICGIEIEDKQALSEIDKKRMFIDIVPKGPKDDSLANISFYLDADEDSGVILGNVREQLAELKEFIDIGDGIITRSQTEDKDWINNWKEHFKQFYVDDILIMPSWEKAQSKDKEKTIISIDPGTAFGTGMHETTQLCIRQLKKYVTQNTKLLDVGTGSGILSIIALKLGAKEAVGTDLDPCTKEAVEENKETNDIPKDAFTMVMGNIIDDEKVQKKVGFGEYDIVVSNILADVLVPLTPVVLKHLKPNGIYITSGIIGNKEESVKAAVIEAGMKIEEITHQGEWVSITARKRG